MTVDKIISEIIEREGRQYTNDPRDSGGPTKFGITQAALARYLGQIVTPQDVETLTEPEARAIYQARYVTEPRFDRVLTLSELVGVEVIDTGVNMGPPVAAMFLQRCLNALNLGGTKYPDVAVDGICGGKTISALAEFLRWRGKEGETVLLRALNCLQGERYIELAEKRAKDEAFVYGWLRTRVTMEAA